MFFVLHEGGPCQAILVGSFWFSPYESISRNWNSWSPNCNVSSLRMNIHQQVAELFHYVKRNGVSLIKARDFPQDLFPCGLQRCHHIVKVFCLEKAGSVCMHRFQNTPSVTHFSFSSHSFLCLPWLPLAGPTHRAWWILPAPVSPVTTFNPADGPSSRWRIRA